jgi:hypothetical protein
VWNDTLWPSIESLCMHLPRHGDSISGRGMDRARTSRLMYAGAGHLSRRWTSSWVKWLQLRPVRE